MPQYATLLRLRIRASWGPVWRAALLDGGTKQSARRYLLETRSRRSARDPIAADALESLLADLRDISIPAFPAPVWGIDGWTTELEWGDHWRAARYSWWGDGRGGWEPLQRIVDRIVELSSIPLPSGGP